MTLGSALIIVLVQRYLRGLLDPTVSLLEVHKLLYFMQEAGEPLRLKYEKAHYGPYAQNLRHVLNAIEGHFISGYADGGDVPEKELRLVPSAIEDAQEFLTQHPDTQTRFEKVSQLVEGFESPQGLELLATVHWLSKYERVQSTEALVQKVHSWNARKQMFTARQIAIAEQVLTDQSWITA